MILISAYFYDRFSKMERGVTSDESIKNAKNIAMISLIFIIIAIAVLFLLFFGFQTRMVGVSVSAPASSMRFTGPERVSFSPSPYSMGMPPGIEGNGNGSFAPSAPSLAGNGNGSFVA